MDDGSSESRRGGVWDPLASLLRALRQQAGEPSFAEVARRISERRVAAGASEHAARIARSTVHDAFRMGRSRINLPLIREIAAVLGGDNDSVDEWVARCHEIPVASSPSALTAAPAVTSAPETITPTKPVVDDVAPALTVPTRRIVLLLLVCIAVNLVGRILVDFLDLPIYLDMVGTAIASVGLGPWRGALVGGATNIVGVIGSGVVSIPFGIVNIAGALVWGYGIRRFDMGRTLPRYFVLNLIVAATCTSIAVPIIVLYGGSVGQGEDITTTFYDLTHTLALSVGLSNSLTSVADKLISGFVALVAVSALPAALRIGLRLPIVHASPHPHGAHQV